MVPPDVAAPAPATVLCTQLPPVDVPFADAPAHRHHLGERVEPRGPPVQTPASPCRRRASGMTTLLVAGHGMTEWNGPAPAEGNQDVPLRTVAKGSGGAARPSGGTS